MAATKVQAIPRANVEFDFHVLKHRNRPGPPSYTVAVWERTQLRSLCHVKALHPALESIARELGEQTDSPAVEFRQWSEVVDLVKRLSHRADTDCIAAAGYIDELHSKLHNTTADLAWVVERMQQIGALLDDAAAKARSIGEPAICRNVLIPEDTWFRLLRVYRFKEEGLELQRELQRLREVAGIAAETLRTVDNWLGHASTRESAMDALWRLRRILEAVGFSMPLDNLAFRGQIIRAMEEAGVGLGKDGTLRVRSAEDKNWEPASGQAVKDVLDNAVQHTQ